MCPFCGAEEATVLGSLGRGEIHLRCRFCFTVYTEPTTDYHEPDYGPEEDYEE